MDKTDSRYSAYVQILKEELLPAMGCTEPIAIAYAAAKAAAVLGTKPECESELPSKIAGNLLFQGLSLSSGSFNHVNICDNIVL